MPLYLGVRVYLEQADHKLISSLWSSILVKRIDYEG